MNETSIQWTNFSTNMLKYRDSEGKAVWACVKVSDGCKNCYSESTAKRWNRGGPFSLPVMKVTTPYFCEKEAAQVLRSKKISGKMVFSGDMTDLFGDWVSDEIIAQHFEVFSKRPDVIFQVLTKRPERMTDSMAQWITNDNGNGEWRNPLPNVWLGCSVENQKAADERIPHLLRCPAAVRFISCEPLLGGVDLRFGDNMDRNEDSGVGCYSCERGGVRHQHYISEDCQRGIHWVIIGGESGANARPFDVAWARSIILQCKAAGVAVFYKQGGTSNKCKHDNHGGHIDCFADDLKIREFPNAKL